MDHQTNLKLQQQRQKEKEFLQNLRDVLSKAKLELGNDLNKLRAKSLLPIMHQETSSEPSQERLSQSTNEDHDDDDKQHEMQQLEPLDLDM